MSDGALRRRGEGGVKGSACDVALSMNECWIQETLFDKNVRYSRTPAATRLCTTYNILVPQ